MNKQVDQASVATTLSRRSFVEGTAGLMFAFTLGGVGRVPDALGATQAAKINAWVTIGADDTVTILCPSAEMGQGVMTSLPLILAEELDADWSKGKVEFAPEWVEVQGEVRHAKPEVLWQSARAIQGGANPRRKRLRSRLFHAAARGRRPGPPRADRQRSRGMESARKRAVDGQGLRRPRQIRTSHLLRRDHQVRHRPYRAAEHHCRGLEEAGAGQADRAQGYRPPRRSIESQRNGQVWNRRADSGHGLRLGIGGSSRRRQGRSPHMGDVTKIKGVTKVIPLPFGVAVIGDTVEATRAGRT